MPDPHLGRNPFLYGKPVPPDRFFDRQSTLRTLFSRLYNCESTAIVGEPHIGKSSVFRYVTDAGVQRQWLGKGVEQYVFVDIDCDLLPSSFDATHFWAQVIERVCQIAANAALKEQCDSLLQNNYGSFALETLFRQLAKRNWRVVLLIDEFDVLLHHPHFNNAEFFGALRSLATRTDGLMIITASRKSVAEMNHRSQEINPHGSPFFNNMIEVRVLPFTPAEAQQLIETTLAEAGSPIRFEDQDQTFLYALTGGHPYLLQSAAASLYDTLAEGRTNDARHTHATNLFNQRAAAHFDDFWQHLDPSEQRALFLLAFAEYRGYVDGRSFDMGDLGKLERYAPDLRHLRDLSIVASEPAPGAVSWLGDNWRITVGGIVPWLMDNIVSGTREAKDFAEWLRDKEYQGLFTREETTRLKDIASKIPKGAVSTAAEFIKSLLFKK